MKLYMPDRKSLTTLRILALGITMLFVIAVKIFIKIYILSLIISIVLAIAALVADFIYMPMYFSHLKYYADGKEIRKTSGVFFKTSKSIKYSSIQYATFASMPFSRVTGFNFIIFYVYGGRLALFFLKSDDAEEILKKSGCLYCREV